jgi:F-type H+-transporting ATPase subunit gamma
MVTTMAAGMSGDDHPLFEAREGGKTVVIHFTSDRGLCGGFNNNLNRMVNKSRESGELGAEVELVMFGRKGSDFFRRRNVPVARALVQLREAERRDMIREVREDLVARFLTGEISRVMLAYNHYYNPIRQLPVILPLLPVTAPQAEEGEQGGQGAALDDREILFEPDRGAILDSLLPAYLQNQVLTAHLNTEAGEHGARMVAMEGATKNAGEMITSLTLSYNRLRQAAITKELIEIVSGAEAL